MRRAAQWRPVIIAEIIILCSDVLSSIGVALIAREANVKQ